jgi:hypothetical protein
MELSEHIKLATKKYCLYKLVSLGEDRNIIYDINIKELDQVFCAGYHSLSLEPEYLKFIEWMIENAQLIGVEDKCYRMKMGYLLPLSHKIKHLSPEMKAIIAFIQGEDDNNFVICTDEVLYCAGYEGFWFNLWMKFRKRTGFYSKFIDGLFRNKRLDIACGVVESRR